MAREKPDELSDAIVELLRDRDVCAQLGAAGHARWRDEYRFSVFDRRLQTEMSQFLEN